MSTTYTTVLVGHQAGVRVIPGPGITHHNALMLWRSALSNDEVRRFASLITRFLLTETEFEEAKKLYYKSGQSLVWKAGRYYGTTEHHDGRMLETYFEQSEDVTTWKIQTTLS